MELTFSKVNDSLTGHFPDAIQFYDTSAEVFFTEGGKLYGQSTQKIKGNWDQLSFNEPLLVSKDEDITDFEVNVLGGFGAVGSYRSGNTHKMILYEFAFEMDSCLESGSIKMQIDNPINSFTLELANPIDMNSDKKENVAITEHDALLSPGAKISFNFAMGDSELLEMGSFFIDRSEYSVLGETVSVEGRNIIGKILRDQTVDEKNFYEGNFVSKVAEKILMNAGINSDQCVIENTIWYRQLSLKPNTTFLDALNQLFKLMITWRLEEQRDGTLVLGSTDFVGFEEKTSYRFYRDKDIFSRQITRDDADAYRRVCVHNNDLSIRIYREVIGFEGWNLQSNKTLYVSIPEGTSTEDITAYADELANRLENVGKIESFTGPFRPQLLIGDEAVILKGEVPETLGLITEIEHSFGKSGFYTNFTVDSGGRLGKGRLSDYISKITKSTESGIVGY